MVKSIVIIPIKDYKCFEILAKWQYDQNIFFSPHTSAESTFFLPPAYTKMLLSAKVMRNLIKSSLFYKSWRFIFIAISLMKGFSDSYSKQ